MTAETPMLESSSAVQVVNISGELQRTPIGTGPIVSVVTRSGTNQLHGAAGTIYQNENWNGNNAPGGTSAGFEIVQPDVSLGGRCCATKPGSSAPTAIRTARSASAGRRHSSRTSRH